MWYFLIILAYYFLVSLNLLNSMQKDVKYSPIPIIQEHDWEGSDSVVRECLTRDRRAAVLEPHGRHFVVVFEKDIFILA